MRSEDFVNHSKEIAASVRVAINNEYDESIPLEQIEQAVTRWLEIRFEDLVADAVQLLTEPRFGYAKDFYIGVVKAGNIAISASDLKG